jgi:hypothetical protein
MALKTWINYSEFAEAFTFAFRKYGTAIKQSFTESELNAALDAGRAINAKVRATR